jgi:hypothetical protein
MPFDINGNILTDIQVKHYNELTVIRDGLVMYLDAGISNSYPGSGSSWFDLSGNGHNGTLTNGAGYSTQFGGVITFDGTNDYVEVPTPNMASSNYTVFGVARYVTVDSAVYPSSVEAGRIISARSNNWLLGHWGGYTGNYFAEGWVSVVGAGDSDTNWKFLAGTGNISGDVYEFYQNGSFLFSNNGGSQGPNGFRFGSYVGGSEFANAQLGAVLVYNRVLTRMEILQLTNYFRPRYHRYYDCGYGCQLYEFDPGCPNC